MQKTTYTPEDIAKAYARFGLNSPTLIESAYAIINQRNTIKSGTKREEGERLSLEKTFNRVIARLAYEHDDLSFFRGSFVSLSQIVDISLQQIGDKKKSFLSTAAANAIDQDKTAVGREEWLNKDILDLTPQDLTKMLGVLNFGRGSYQEILVIQQILVASKRFSLPPIKVMETPQVPAIVRQFHDGFDLIARVASGLSQNRPGFSRALSHLLSNFGLR